MTSKCSLDKHNQEFIQKSNLLTVPVDPNNSFNPKCDSPTDLDDICTSISQVPINPLYIENPTSVSKIALPEGKLLEDDRFWGLINADLRRNAQMNLELRLTKAQVEKQSEMLDNPNIIEFTSESVDSFTPNKKKEKLLDSITRWSVALIANNLVIVGNDSDGKRQITSCCRRISGNIFHDNNGIVCSLLGPSEPASDLPKYISDKFKTGIPVDWQSVVITWGHFQSLGCPASYKWPTMSQSYSHVNNYETDTEIGPNQSTVTVQQLRKKITKLQTRYRTMLFRESLLGNCTNSIQDSSLYLSSNVDIPSSNSNNKKITNVNISRSGKEIKDPNVHAVDNLFLRDKTVEVVSFHKKTIPIPEENSDISESDTESEKNTDSLHLQIVSSARSNVSYPKTNEETTNNPKVNKNQQIKVISKTNEHQLKVTPKTNESLTKINPKTNENQRHPQMKVITKTNENHRHPQMKVTPKTNEKLAKINPKTKESQAQVNPKTNENLPEFNDEPVDGTKTVEEIISDSEMIFPDETNKTTEEPKSANTLTISGSSSFVSSLSKVSSINEVVTAQSTKVLSKNNSQSTAKTVDQSTSSDSDDSSEHENLYFKQPNNIKVSSITENNTSPKTTPNKSNNSETNVAVEEEFPKKRGRPPKPISSLESGGSPKKRGQLPKNKSVTDKSENKIEVIPETIAPLPVVILTPVDITTLQTSVTPKSNNVSTNKLKNKMVPQLPEHGFLVPSSVTTIRKSSRNTSKTNQEVSNSSDLDSTKKRARTSALNSTKDDKISECNNSNVTRSGRIRVPIEPFWMERPPQNKSVTEPSVTTKPTNASPSKLKEKMVPQLPEDGFLVPASITTIKKSSRTTSVTRKTNQEVSNTLHLDSTKKRGRISALNSTKGDNISECSSSNVSHITNSSISRSGRVRVPTLPFWMGHRLKVHKDEVMIERSVTEKCNISSYVNNDTINDQPVSKTKVSLTYEEVFQSYVYKNAKTSVDMQLMSTLRNSLIINDSVTNKSLMKINEQSKSPVRNKKSTNQKSPERQMSAKKQSNSAATETIDSCSSDRSKNINIVALNSPKDKVTANRNKSPIKKVSRVKSTTKTKTNSPQKQMSAKKLLNFAATETSDSCSSGRSRNISIVELNSSKDKVTANKNKSPVKNVSLIKSTSKTKTNSQKQLSAKKQLTKTTDHNSSAMTPMNRRRIKSSSESYSSEDELEEKTKSVVKNVSLVKSTSKTKTNTQDSRQKQLSAKKQLTNHNSSAMTPMNRRRIKSSSESNSSEDELEEKTKSVKNVSLVKSTSKTKTNTQDSRQKQLSAKKQLTNHNSSAMTPMNRRRIKSSSESNSSEDELEEKTKSPVKNVSLVKSTSKTKTNTQDSRQKQLSAKKQLTKTTEHNSSAMTPMNRRRIKSSSESYSSEDELEEKTKSPVKNVSLVKSVNKTQPKNQKCSQKQLTAKKQLTYPEKTTEHVETNENINSRSGIESSSSEDYDDSYSSGDNYKPRKKAESSVTNVKTPVKSVSKTQSKNQKSPRKQLTAKKQLTNPEETTERVETNENGKQLPIRKRTRSMADTKNSDQKCDIQIYSPLRKKISNKKLICNDSHAFKLSEARKDTKNTPKNAKPENKSSKCTTQKRKNLELPLQTRRSSERRRSDINYNEKAMWETNSKNKPQAAKLQKSTKKSKRKSTASNNFNFIAQDITCIEENIPRRSSENNKMGPKITAKFKAAKPKKIKKLEIPTDQSELFLLAAKTKKVQRKVATVVRPSPKKPSSKKRKLFACNSWLQSDECLENLSKNNPENEMTSPKFVLTFEPNIKMPVDDDVFSEVSALIK